MFREVLTDRTSELVAVNDWLPPHKIALQAQCLVLMLSDSRVHVLQKFEYVVHPMGLTDLVAALPQDQKHSFASKLGGLQGQAYRYFCLKGGCITRIQTQGQFGGFVDGARMLEVPDWKWVDDYF